MMTHLEKQGELIDILLSACPGIKLQSATLVEHDGELNDILLVNDELVFRFPRHAGSIPDALREMELLPRLEPYLALPIPRPVYKSGSQAKPGQVFMGYRFLNGQPLTASVLKGLPGPALQQMAGQLTQFLTALHHLEPESLGLDLPRLNMPDWVRTFFTEIQQHLFFYMRDDACKAVSENIEGYFAQVDLQQYQCSLVHGDFGGSNILIDGDRISGVLDFTGMCISDPALDIASVSTYGEAFFNLICQSYPVDDSLARRARFYRSLFALEEALYGWKNGDEEAFGHGMEAYI